MNTRTLRLVGIVGLIFTVLLGLDALYMLVTNYKPDDTGNNTLHMSDGTTVLIAAGLLLIISIVAFVLSNQAARRAGEVPGDTMGVTPVNAASSAAASTDDGAVANNQAEIQDTTQPEIQR